MQTVCIKSLMKQIKDLNKLRHISIVHAHTLESQYCKGVNSTQNDIEIESNLNFVYIVKQALKLCGKTEMKQNNNRIINDTE